MYVIIIIAIDVTVTLVMKRVETSCLLKMVTLQFRF